MDMNYPSNSHKEKEALKNAQTNEEKKNVEKVVTGTAKKKQKSAFAKFFGEFISENAANLKQYIVSDVIIPTIKRTISESIDMILYGRSRKSNTPATKISYSAYWSDPRAKAEAAAPRPKLSYNYDEVVLDSRGDAEVVLSQMNDLIDTYGMVSVADLYDLVGISGDYTDNKYGWTNIRNAEVIRGRDGYALNLPKPLPIK